MTYADGAYDAAVTTRPGATFALTSSSNTSTSTACIATTKGVTGLLTTYSVHCPGARNAAPMLKVRVNAANSGASAVAPLAVGTNP